MNKLIQWDHPRGSWQYDVFCLLIIAFIFLTPNSWFDSNETLATSSATSAVKEQSSSPGDNRPANDQVVQGTRKN